MGDISHLLNKIHLGDCLEFMRELPDNSIDMVLCDLPYGTTACKWDVVIPFEPLWDQYWRVCKPNAAIVLTASQPFTSCLVMSQLKYFKYEWIWEKAVGSNFAILNYQPMKEHENICVFSRESHNYFPIKQGRKGSGEDRIKYAYNETLGKTGEANGSLANIKREYSDTERFPSSIQYFNNRDADRGMHPTQKPVPLFEYLIKTYSKVGDCVMDNCSGSGTTAIAANNTNRNFICIEKDPDYHAASVKRLEEHQKQGKLF